MFHPQWNRQINLRHYQDKKSALPRGLDLLTQDTLKLILMERKANRNGDGHGTEKEWNTTKGYLSLKSGGITNSQFHVGCKTTESPPTTYCPEKIQRPPQCKYSGVIIIVQHSPDSIPFHSLSTLSHHRWYLRGVEVATERWILGDGRTTCRAVRAGTLSIAHRKRTRTVTLHLADWKFDPSEDLQNWF